MCCLPYFDPFFDKESVSSLCVLRVQRSCLHFLSSLSQCQYLSFCVNLHPSEWVSAVTTVCKDTGCHNTSKIFFCYPDQSSTYSRTHHLTPSPNSSPKINTRVITSLDEMSGFYTTSLYINILFGGIQLTLCSEETQFQKISQKRFMFSQALIV